MLFLAAQSTEEPKGKSEFFSLEIHLELHWKNSEAATVSKLTTAL
jgi:hypothetical protein